ncbi:redoxin domain-containing protein [Desulfobulbus alkaliphilus]|nr:redoxin domain-containing protein [Desulfobulbus alkaliphilus]
MPRVQVNTQAPDFSLPDLQGRTVTLSDFFGHRHVVVVFNRGFL